MRCREQRHEEESQMDAARPGFHTGGASRRRFLAAANGGGGGHWDQAHHPRVCGGGTRPTRPLALGFTVPTPTPLLSPYPHATTVIDPAPTANKTCTHLVRVGLAFKPLTPMSMCSADHQTSREHRPAEESQWRASTCLAFRDLPVLSPFLAGRIGANAALRLHAFPWVCGVGWCRSRLSGGGPAVGERAVRSAKRAA